MDPILLQKQLRDNTNDLQDFCKELKEWSTDMKRKEESVNNDDDNTEKTTNKIRKQKGHAGSGDAPDISQKPNKIKGTDYAAWEKFDVEKECEKVDKRDSESELTDEYDESMKDEAIFEKEKGNRFVKNQKWDSAIECYTKAIACYGYDPIFYANRALCFLKKEKWKEAESDCTTALQLDKTYVKAYQRRAAAREKLDQLAEAEMDLEKVLEQEPKNKESKAALDRIQELLNRKSNKTDKQDSSEIQRRPVSKFTQMRQGNKTVSSSTAVTTTQKTEEKSNIGFDDRNAVVIERKEEIAPKDTSSNVETKQTSVIASIKKGFLWPEDDTVNLIEPISKPPHARSKVPLKRIQIKDIEINPVKSVKKSELIPEEMKFAAKRGNRKKSVTFADINVKTSDEVNESPSTSSMNNEDSGPELIEPTSSVQFFLQWKRCAGDSDLKYKYLKVIEPKNLKDIFKEALDSKIFSDILNVLFEHSDDHSFVYGFLMGLANVPRFCTLTFFMSKTDKEGVRAIIDLLKTSGNYTDENIQNLLKSFQL